MQHFQTFHRTALAAALALAFAAGAQAQTIGALQGSSHLSTFANMAVANIAGIVTAVESSGFWIQDAGDGNALTSDGIYVFRSSGSKPLVGDDVRVSGTLKEFRPGGSAVNLTTTEIDAVSGSWTRVSSGNALPAPVVIQAGFLPPSLIAPNVGNVETAAGYTLQPSQYAIDFYESLEGMRVSLPSAISVGPRNSFGEIPVVATAQIGAPGTITSPRGGVVIGPGQFNGQRIQLDDRLLATPSVHSGAELANIVGVMDYSFSNYKLNVTQAVSVVSNNLTREVAAIPEGKFAMASYNVENLGGDASAARITQIAAQIKNTLGAPHLISLQEVQDNNGATNNGVVAADVTLSRLAAELNAQTGRNYQFVTVNPVNNADGGQTGGNIRQAFLYDAARVTFSGVVGGALDAITATSVGGKIQLSLGAGRIDPTNTAFANSRKPLVTEFTVDGQKIIVVSNHFNSKGGDQPLFGPSQAPVLSSATQRLQQAQAVAAFVQSLLAIDANANIVVAGDLNDFQFADTLAPLAAAGLINLTNTLPAGERYTYNFEGNLQALDHMLVSPHLMNSASLVYDVVHANAEFSDQLSDHDPTLLTMSLAPVPEPETYALMLAGLAIIGARVRRLRRG
ncbi:MAG: endonuclease/exonuclease/phosphatase family protein [Rhodoferax sp.]